MEPIAIISALSQFAPQLVKWITGNDKAEEVAKTAMDVAMQVTGAGTGNQAIATLGAKPDLAIAFQTALLERESELEKAYLADVDSARKMQIAALQQDDTFSKRFIYYFAIGWSLFTAIYFLCVTFISVPSSGQRVADTVLGVLIGTVVTGFFQFFYGSSARSQKKDDLIHNLSSQK
jgi:hypothetical protein